MLRARNRKRGGGGGGGSPPPFTPASISGCVLWLDSTDPATLWADTAGTVPATTTVGRWSDKSGNGNHATQGTGAKQPLTNAATMNGQNIVRLDGSDTLVLPAALYTVTTGNNALFIAYRTVLSANGYIMCGVNGANYFGQRVIFNNVVVSAFNGNIGASSNVGMTDNTDPRLVINEKTAALFYGKQGATTGGSTAAVDFTMSNLFIGSENDSGNYLTGDIGGIAFYNRALSAAEKNQLGAYYNTLFSTPYTAV